jgi:hypothetical protein
LNRSYFSTDGIEYGLGRVPIGGSDFSTRAYTYDDFPGDDSLSNFSLTREDLFFKVNSPPILNYIQLLLLLFPNYKASSYLIYS